MPSLMEYISDSDIAEDVCDVLSYVHPPSFPGDAVACLKGSKQNVPLRTRGRAFHGKIKPLVCINTHISTPHFHSSAAAGFASSVQR